MDGEKTGNSRLNLFIRGVKKSALQNLVRPFLHMREGETISFAEKNADFQVAKVTRQLLSLSGLTSQTSCTSFGQMHYYDSAPQSGEVPLVLLHGIGSSGQCYSMIAEVLHKKRRIILPDLFHFSGFSKPNNPVMNFEEHVSSIQELLNDLGCSECDFVGLSLGGWIGLQIAATQPGVIRRLMLLNSAGLRFGSITLRDRLTYLSWEKFQKYFPGILYAPPYRGVRVFSPIVRRSLYRLLKDHAVRDFLKTLRPSDFMEPKLAQIHCQVLLLWGDRDSFLSQQFPHHFVRHIPRIKGYYVEDSAHILCLEAPLNVLTHMDRFFRIGIDFRQPLMNIYKRVFKMHAEREIGSNREVAKSDSFQVPGFVAGKSKKGAV